MLLVSRDTTETKGNDMGLQDVLNGAEPNWNQVETTNEGGDSDMIEVDGKVDDPRTYVTGTYMGHTSHLSKFPNPKTGQKDKYTQLLKFKRLDGTDAVMWAKGNLWYQMKDVPEGTLVKVERLPNETTKDGYNVTSWVVFTAS